MGELLFKTFFALWQNRIVNFIIYDTLGSAKSEHLCFSFIIPKLSVKMQSLPISSKCILINFWFGKKIICLSHVQLFGRYFHGGTHVHLNILDKYKTINSACRVMMLEIRKHCECQDQHSHLPWNCRNLQKWS